MAGARQQQEWSHTSTLLAMLANCHRDPKKTRPFKPTDFQPRPAAPQPTLRPKAHIGLLKQVFVERRI